MDVDVRKRATKQIEAALAGVQVGVEVAIHISTITNAMEAEQCAFDNRKRGRRVTYGSDEEGTTFRITL